MMDGLLGAKDQCFMAQATAAINVLQSPIFQTQMFDTSESK